MILEHWDSVDENFIRRCRGTPRSPRPVGRHFVEAGLHGREGPPHAAVPAAGVPVVDVEETGIAVDDERISKGLQCSFRRFRVQVLAYNPNTFAVTFDRHVGKHIVLPSDCRPPQDEVA